MPVILQKRLSVLIKIKTSRPLRLSVSGRPLSKWRLLISGICPVIRLLTVVGPLRSSCVSGHKNEGSSLFCWSSGQQVAASKCLKSLEKRPGLTITPFFNFVTEMYIVFSMDIELQQYIQKLKSFRTQVAYGDNDVLL